jgi:hypothetical protein
MRRRRAAEFAHRVSFLLRGDLGPSHMNQEASAWQLSLKPPCVPKRLT